jgi:hypothetical protein
MKGYDNRLKIKGYDKIKKLGMWDVVETDITYIFTIKITHLDKNLDITNREITHQLDRIIIDDTIELMTILDKDNISNSIVVVKRLMVNQIRDINEFVEILKDIETEILK